MLETIQQRQLIHENGTQSKAASSYQPFGRNLSVTIEDALEVLVEVLHREGAQLVKDAPHLHAIISVWVRAMMRSCQPPPFEGADCPQQQRVVVSISQHVSDVRGQWALAQPYQLGSLSTVIVVGRGKFSSQRYPHVCYYCDEM